MDAMHNANQDGSQRNDVGHSDASDSSVPHPAPENPSSCGCGESVPKDSCLPPPPPPVSGGSSACGCDACGGWKAFLWGILIVLVVLLAWSFWTARSDSAMAQLVPAEAVLYLEANDIEGIGMALAASPLWKEHEGGAGVRELQDKGFEQVALALGSVRERVARDLVRHADAFAIGYVPGDGGSLDWIAALRTSNEAALLDVLRKEVASEREKVRIGGEDVERLTLFHGGNLHVLSRNGHVVLTPSARQVEFLLAKRGTRASVADLGVIPESSVPALHILTSVQPLVKEVYGQGLLDRIPAFLPSLEPRVPLSERINPNARLRASLRFPAGRAELDTTMLAPEEVRPRGRGLLSYLLWTVLILVLIVIAIPLVFLVSVLVLAAYFYLMAWWRGELSPSSPPTPKPLSPQAREDLGIPNQTPGGTTTDGHGGDDAASSAPEATKETP